MNNKKFKSGKWEGYYQAKGKKHLILFEVEFKNKIIKGKGTDELLGNFNISGNYNDMPPYSCQLFFEYSANSNALEFNGWRESSKGGIIGEFLGVEEKGNFVFYPVEESEENIKKKEEAIKKETKNTLLLMGFEENIIDQALLETNGVEPAINWITQQKNHPDNEQHEVNQQYLQQLIDMGFNKDLAIQALLTTENVESAINWLFDQ